MHARRASDTLRSGTVLLLGLAAIKVILHLATSGSYGYFRDELYYIACSEHLAAGYVDHPPLSIAVLALSRWALGDSLLALRLAPALAGGLLIVLTGLLARELGGGRFAQGLAALAVVVAPVYLAMQSFFSMNAFEPLAWGAATYILIRLTKGQSLKLWLLFGIVAGLGVENKHSMLFFGFGTVVALLLTPNRRWLRTGGPWFAGLVAVVIFLPNLIWEAVYQWPTLEFMRNAQAFKNYPLSPGEFVGQQILMLHPFALPLWVAGAGYFLCARAGRPYRLLGWLYTAVLALFVIEKAKAYYLAPVYPMLLAGGAVAVEQFTARPHWRWLRSAYTVTLVLGGLVTMPMGLPVLPVETFVRYSRSLALDEAARKAPSERHEMGVLPQYFGDRFGWEEMVDSVARAYEGLSPDDRAKAAIYAQNYGEAGAIDVLGRARHLPHAISGHNNYWLWGPGPSSGEVVIALGPARAELEALFEKVEQVDTVHCRYCMPYENNRPVYVCRHLKRPLQEVWPRLKRYI